MNTSTENNGEIWTSSESAFNATDETPSLVDLRVPRYCVFVPIFLFSVTGNTLVILTVVLLRKMKTVPMILTANLAACDLITTVSSITFDLPEYELGYWPYGGVLCKIIWPLATFSTNAAALTLVAISVDRYISIICPLNLQYRITKGKCLKIIASIHIVSALAVVPYVVILKYNESPEGAICGENWPDGYSLDKVYTVVLFVLQYGLPVIVMSTVYTWIGLKLCKNTGKAAELSAGKTKRSRTATCSSGQALLQTTVDKAVNSLQKRKRQNEKTAKMFLVIVVIFLIFMMPHQLLWLSYEYASHTKGFKRNQELIVFVCRAFTYANSVLNAIIYGVCIRNFRRGFLSIVKCQCSKAQQRNQERKAKRSETMFAANFRSHQDSFRSQTSTLESACGVKENSARFNELKGGVNLDRNDNAIANGIKSSGIQRGHGVVSKSRNKNFLERNEPQKNPSFHTPVDKPWQRSRDNIVHKNSSAKPDTHKSLHDNTSPSRNLFQVVSERDTLFWLSETEALLNRLYMELDTAGEKGVMSEKQQELTFLKQNADKQLFHLKLCEEKETIL